MVIVAPHRLRVARADDRHHLLATIRRHGQGSALQDCLYLNLRKVRVLLKHEGHDAGYVRCCGTGPDEERVIHLPAACHWGGYAISRRGEVELLACQRVRREERDVMLENVALRNVAGAPFDAGRIIRWERAGPTRGGDRDYRCVAGWKAHAGIRAVARSGNDYDAVGDGIIDR